MELSTIVAVDWAVCTVVGGARKLNGPNQMSGEEQERGRLATAPGGSCRRWRERGERKMIRGRAGAAIFIAL